MVCHVRTNKTFHENSEILLASICRLRLFACLVLFVLLGTVNSQQRQLPQVKTPDNFRGS